MSEGKDMMVDPALVTVGSAWRCSYTTWKVVRVEGGVALMESGIGRRVTRASQPIAKMLKCRWAQVGACEPEGVKVGDLVRDPEKLSPGMRVRIDYMGRKPIAQINLRHALRTMWTTASPCIYNVLDCYVKAYGVTVVGLPESSAPAPVPATEKRRPVCARLFPGVGLCDRAPGHEGKHHDSETGVSWPVETAAPPAAPCGPAEKPPQPESPCDPRCDLVRPCRRAGCLAAEHLKAEEKIFHVAPTRDRQHIKHMLDREERAAMLSDGAAGGPRYARDAACPMPIPGVRYR